MKQWQCLVRASVIFEACSTESCWKGSGTKWLSKNTLSNNSSQIRWLTQTRHHLANSRFIILPDDITRQHLKGAVQIYLFSSSLWLHLSVSDTRRLDSMEAEFLDLLELQNVVKASNCWMSEFVQWHHLEPSALTKTQYSGALPVRSARVWAPVRDFTLHTNSRELLKAPNEALMEAVYALTGLFVVVVFTLFVYSVQNTFFFFLVNTIFCFAFMKRFSHFTWISHNKLE